MSFTVTLAEVDVQFPCEETQSILDAALNQGIMLSYGCKNGFCGSCKGNLISGNIDYPEGVPGGLDEDEMELGEALFCKAVPLSDVTIKVNVIKVQNEIEVKTLPAKVQQIEHLSGDVIKLILQLLAVEIFEFNAGQWIYILLKDGRKRAFSIANAPNEKNQLELQIRHAVGGVFTDFVFNTLKQDALLQIEGPQGTFFYQQDERPLLLVAGGTGFAPIKGIFEELSKQTIDYPVHLFWGSRAKQDLYQENLVKQWVEEFGIKYTPVLSEPDEDDDWQGKTGFVHQAVIEEYLDLKEFAVYMAGPPQMIQSSKDSFIPAGLDEDRLYFDSFDYSTDALTAMNDEDNG